MSSSGKCSLGPKDSLPRPLRLEAQGQVPSWLGLRVILFSDPGIINLASMDSLKLCSKSFWFVCMSIFWEEVLQFSSDRSTENNFQLWSLTKHLPHPPTYSVCPHGTCAYSPAFSLRKKILEDSANLELLAGTGHLTLPNWQEPFHSTYLPEGNESISSHKDKGMNVCSILICNSPKWETTQTSINK